jgi:hypothetical protein
MRLADNIVRTQTAEIATMRSADQRLKAAGVKQGSLGVAQHMMGMNGDMSMLRTAKPFDVAFTRMMTPHHQGVVVMADAELKHGKDPALKTLAHHIISAQTARDQPDAQAARQRARRPEDGHARHRTLRLKGHASGAALPTDRRRRALVRGR